ncbi:MAG TPA: 16S rRNA (uracil(1498)-N(3))-methyltransferase [Chromatiaceae bacterium]|nr:16S rRNA (uracil(1498)-N(3))-methyltransferase [Chromatiaceae bacterium]
MRLPRSHVDLPLSAGAQLQLPARVARHLQQVLRMKAGEELLLFNGKDGRGYRARLLLVRKDDVRVEILHASEPEQPPRLALQLALGISRGERMDFALQKAVELGAVSVTPLFTERTVVRLNPQRLEKRLRHWRGVITSATEQSGRRWPTRLQRPESLESWLEHRPKSTLLLDPRAAQSLPDVPHPGSEPAFLIGPEGGFSEEERELAYRSGCTGVRLGPRILRAETAPLAAMAAAQVLWGDFR